MVTEGPARSAPITAGSEAVAVVAYALGALSPHHRAPSDATLRRSWMEGSEMSVTQLSKVLYTAEATTEGGREGHGRTADGHLDVQLSVPKEQGGQGGPGTNPEELFAIGFGACFMSAMQGVATGRKLDLSDSQMNTKVGIGPTGQGGFGLQVAMDLHAPHLSPAEAAGLMARGEERCPYSNATRGNIQVTLSVDGTPIDQLAA
jgi:osmotically inducible protein OsmC